jgi:hypothetical protein
MIFLKISLDVARGRGLHATDEPLVERLRGVDARVAQQVIQRDDLGNYRDVFARVQKYRDLGELDTEDGCGLDIEASALHDGVLMPLLELNHNLNALLLPDSANPEDRRNIDQSNPRISM